MEGRHGPALLRAVYDQRQILVRPELPGIFPFADWLPVGNYFLNIQGGELGRPITYRSHGLAARLGIENLFIAFSGYWPERSANIVTRTFKEFECQASIARYLYVYQDSEPKPLIVASAGNTGNAYNLISYYLKIPFYLIVPEYGLEKLLLPIETTPCIVAVRGDYSDAIELADQLSARIGLARDGGVLNVARRAGMGAAMLNAVVNPVQGSGQLFDHYVQAVGSGSGAIAAWEMVQLLLADGRFGNTVTRMHIAQNNPFTPIVDAWHAGSREILSISEETAKERIHAVTADVLTHRKPPYGIHGGLYDMLQASRGMTWRVTNYNVFLAARMFREAEGIDIGPAAAVALDALRQAVQEGEIDKQDSVLLHVTGGGRESQYARGSTGRAKASLVVNRDELDKTVAFLGTPGKISRPGDMLREYH